MNIELFLNHYRNLGRLSFTERMAWWHNAHPMLVLSPEELERIERPSPRELEEQAASIGETTD